ncbi:MAG: hypothetical protein Ct9H90mP17_4930 [Actinomycetota bacterium]|nr:MAG: hypothetical protein Ct9H90mP17_4930 [Actinomycetota bacterium]
MQVKLHPLASLDANEELQSNVEVYKKNRKDTFRRITESRFKKKFSPPDGAFYIYVDISEYSNDSLAFCKKFLKMKQMLQ